MDVFSDLKEVAKTQVELCLKDPDAYVRTLASSGATRWILQQIYLSLIRSKELPVIESLSRDKKMYYWDTSKKEGAGLLTLENLYALSKALYVLDHLLKPYINGTEEQQAG